MGEVQEEFDAIVQEIEGEKYVHWKSKSRLCVPLIVDNLQEVEVAHAGKIAIIKQREELGIVVKWDNCERRFSSREEIECALQDVEKLIEEVSISHS